MLTDQERRAISMRRRRWLIIAAALLILLGIVAVAARPARDAIKGWQARRHAQKAFRFIGEQKWKEAHDAATAAYQLRRTEPFALRAVARLLSRTRQQQALEFWDQLAKQGPLTREDLRDEASIALLAADVPRAGRAIAELLKDSPASIDQLLAAQLALQKGAVTDALPHLDAVLANAGATEQEQFDAAVLQVRATSAAAGANPHRTTAWQRIETLSTGSSAVALQTLVLRAQQALSSPATANPVEAGVPPASPQPDAGDTPAATNARSAIRTPHSELQALAAALESHPLAKAPHKLLALDLLAQADASQRDALIDRAIATWQNADAASLAALAGWLNAKGAYGRQLDSIPLEKALQSREVFLQHVDALGALGRWDEIKRLLEAERFPLDPVMQRMYLARCNAQLGQETASRNNWQRALEAATDDTGKLMMLGQYAEKNGALEIAESCFTQVAARARALRPAQEGRLRLALQRRDTRKIHDVVKEMLAVWPNEAALQNDEAYMRLLLLPPSDPAAADELKQIEELAARLVQQNPASLPHRTLLALARLRQKESARVAEVYEKVVFTSGTVTPSAMAVHAAAMAANGQTDDARREAALVPRDKLLPEERGLIADLL